MGVIGTHQGTDNRNRLGARRTASPTGHVRAFRYFGASLVSVSLLSSVTEGGLSRQQVIGGRGE